MMQKLIELAKAKAEAWAQRAFRFMEEFDDNLVDFGDDLDGADETRVNTHCPACGRGFAASAAPVANVVCIVCRKPVPAVRAAAARG